MNQNSADRFLTAFATIEQRMRSEYASDRHDTFYSLLRTAASSDRFIRKQQQFLQVASDLRNILSHNREDGEHLAAPAESMTRKLEAIAQKLAEPTRVIDLFRRQVVTVTPETEIGDALQLMRENNLSQIPVYRNSVFIGLLTTDTVARWIGVHIKNEILDLKVPVEDALQHKEDIETHLFVSRTAPVPEVIEAFEEHTDKGKRLSAVLITQNGKETEGLLGIVTVYDLPEAIASLG